MFKETKPDLLFETLKDDFRGRQMEYVCNGDD